MKFYLQTLLLAGICLSCQSQTFQQPSSEIRISMQPTELPPLKRVKVVPLETRPDALLGSYITVNVTPDYYVLNDWDKIVIFEKNTGKIHRVIHAQGRSDREYIRLADVCVVQDTLFLLDPMRKRIMRFDLDGNFQGNTSLNADGTQFQVTPSFVYHDVQGARVAENNRLAISNFKGEVVKWDLPWELKVNLRTRKRFQTRGDTCYYLPSLSHVVYTLDGLEAKPRYSFDFGSHGISDALAEELNGIPSSMAIIQRLQDEGKVLYLDFYETAHQIALCFNLGTERYTWVYDKSSGEQYCCSHRHETPSFIQSDIYATDADSFITLIPAMQYLESFQSEKELDLSENDNPVLVIYEL